MSVHTAPRTTPTPSTQFSAGSTSRSGALASCLRGEALRLRKWPALWVILGAWLVLNALFGYVFDYLAYRTGGVGRLTGGASRAQLIAELVPAAVPHVLTDGMAMFGGALMLILGALAVGSGYGWGTWKTIFGQGRSRLAVSAAALVALEVVAIALVAVVFLVDLAISAAIAGVEGASLTLPAAGVSAQAFGAGGLILTMWTAAGALLGALTRGPALSAGLGLVWVLAIENLLRGVANVLPAVRPLTDFLPGTAAGSLSGALHTGLGAERGPGVLTTLGPYVAAATLVVYALLFVSAVLWLLRRRDVD